MNFPKSLIVLALLSTSVLASNTNNSGAVTVKGSKSNSSFKETKVTCKTLACCQQHPNSSGCVGSVLRVECPECKTTKTKAQIEFEKNSGHATEQLKPMQPKGSTTVKGSTQTTSYKETEPTPAASTASEKAIVKSKSNITNNRDAEPTPGPTPKPVGNINLNSSRSNKD